MHKEELLQERQASLLVQWKVPGMAFFQKTWKLIQKKKKKEEEEEKKKEFLSSFISPESAIKINHVPVPERRSYEV